MSTDPNDPNRGSLTLPCWYLYYRLLHAVQATHRGRLDLQDILVTLRNASEAAFPGSTGQEIQDFMESMSCVPTIFSIVALRHLISQEPWGSANV